MQVKPLGLVKARCSQPQWLLTNGDDGMVDGGEDVRWAGYHGDEKDAIVTKKIAQMQ